MRKFLSSRAGRAFFNVCYSWGACLVILGAVLKIMNAPLDDTFLMIGLFVEVFIFFISAFDEPDRVYKWEKAFPVLDKKTGNDSTSKMKYEKLEKLEENVNRLNELYLGKLNEMYEAQIKAVKNGAANEELAKSTEKLAENVSELNERYKKMLNSMN